MDDDSENSLIRIYVPQERESIENYIQRYTFEELRVIFSHPALVSEMCRTVWNLYVPIHGPPTEKTGLQKLWMEMKKMENYGRLKQFVEELRFVREKLLVALDDYATYIEKYAKILSVTRLICSAGDIAGTVIGILMKESTFDYSDKAFATATALGVTGTLSTVTELYLLMNASDDIMQQIKKDKNFFGPIDEWFQQTEPLRQAMLNVFPFDNMSKVFRNFSAAVDRESQKVHLLENFFKNISEIQIRELRNKDFLNNILSLFSMDDVGHLFEVLLFRSNPVELETAKIMVQLDFQSVKHLFCQHIPPLSPHNQDFWTVKVFGRLVFNFLSTLQAFKTLKRSEISELAAEIRYLRKHLGDQMKKLNEITNNV